MKNKYISVIFVALLVLCTPVLCSIQEQQFQGQYQQHKPEADAQQRMQQQASMKRTACLVLSRYHSNNHKQLVQQVVGSLAPTDQQAYINKLYAVAIEKCLPSITTQQAQQFFIQNNNNFDPISMFYLLDGIDYASIANDLQLTPTQKSIVKFIKQFDEEMQVRRQQQAAQNKDVQSEDQIGLFLIPVKHFNSIGGYAYIIVLLAVVIGGFIWGFQQLNNSSLPKNKKNKKKQKKQQ